MMDILYAFVAATSPDGLVHKSRVTAPSVNKLLKSMCRGQKRTMVSDCGRVLLGIRDKKIDTNLDRLTCLVCLVDRYRSTEED
jgi:hypothetical protein